MGATDKAIRILLAIAFAGLYITKLVEGSLGLVLLTVGGILLLTSTINFCPLYSILGMNTSKKKKITELTQDIDRLELRFIKNDIDKDLYQKYRSIFKEEKDLLEKEIESSKFDSSNLENAIKKTIDITGNPLQIWLSSDYDDKQRLQYLIFPDGIRYNKKNKVVRTPKINSVFTCVAEAARVLMENKKGYSEKNSLNSHWVVPPRIELGSKV